MSDLLSFQHIFPPQNPHTLTLSCNVTQHSAYSYSCCPLIHLPDHKMQWFLKTHFYKEFSQVLAQHEYTSSCSYRKAFKRLHLKVQDDIKMYIKWLIKLLLRCMFTLSLWFFLGKTILSNAWHQLAQETHHTHTNMGAHASDIKLLHSNIEIF